MRGGLVNVTVNGRHALAYRLPLPRRPGAVELITYDARAEFTAFELKPLAAWCEEHVVAGTHWLVATVHRRRLFTLPSSANACACPDRTRRSASGGTTPAVLAICEF